MDTFQHVQYIIYNFVLNFPEQDQARKVCLFYFQLTVVQQTTFYILKMSSIYMGVCSLDLHGCVQLRVLARAEYQCYTFELQLDKYSLLWVEGNIYLWAQLAR